VQESKSFSFSDDNQNEKVYCPRRGRCPAGITI